MHISFAGWQVSLSVQRESEGDQAALTAEVKEPVWDHIMVKAATFSE